jgi:hypothetical protein
MFLLCSQYFNASDISSRISQEGTCIYKYLQRMFEMKMERAAQCQQKSRKT